MHEGPTENRYGELGSLYKYYYYYYYIYKCISSVTQLTFTESLCILIQQKFICMFLLLLNLHQANSKSSILIHKPVAMFISEFYFSHFLPDTLQESMQKTSSLQYLFPRQSRLNKEQSSYEPP